MIQRAVIAATLAMLMLAALPTGASATLENKNENRSEDRDGQSRHENGRLGYLPVTLGDDGTLRIKTVILVQTRFIHIVRTSFGVDFKNLDKVDVGDVPLLGSLFGDRLDASDFNAENEVGAAYLAGADSLFAVIDDSIDVSDAELAVVNGPGVYQLVMEPKIIDVVSDDLGELGTLPSVESLLAGTAGPETTVVLGGLNRVDETERDKLPFLGDIPVLGRLFKGTVHEGDKRQLRIFITPSIIEDDGES